MSIKPERKYHGTVAGGSNLTVTQTGTIAYQVMLTCEDGATSFMIWLTPKNKERAEKYFKDVLGVPSDKLKDSTYLEFGLASEIEGREVSFGTREETYNGKTTVKVTWIGKPTSEKLSDDAAQFFGGAPIKHNGKTPITDDDIPF